MAQAAGVKEFLPYVLEADDAPHDGSWPVGGQTRVDLPNHHFQYALTWFWLALILPVIYFVSNWRLDRPEKTGEAEKADETKPD
jgi:surfeit locus 1 family protein